MAGAPSNATTSIRMRPAPRIATVGGRTTGAAYLPAIIPKLDRVIVAPEVLLEACGGPPCPRAFDRVRRANRPRRDCRHRAKPARTSLPANRPRRLGRFCEHAARMVCPSNQALSDGSARQPATRARISRIVVSASLDQLPMSASSTIVAAATSDRASAMFRAIARRNPATVRRARIRPKCARLAPHRRT